jgi:hypothetical protein
MNMFKSVQNWLQKYQSFQHAQHIYKHVKASQKSTQSIIYQAIKTDAVRNLSILLKRTSKLNFI